MSLRWPEAITRYQGCGRVPAAFFIFGVSLVSVTTRNEMADDLGDGPGTGIRQTSPITPRSPFRARLVYDATRWMKRIFFVSIRTFFLMSQGDRRTQDRPGKSFLARRWRGGGRSFCPQKGPLPRPQENTDADGCAAVLPLFCRHKKGGSIAAPPKDDTWSKITLRRLPT